MKAPLIVICSVLSVILFSSMYNKISSHTYGDPRTEAEIVTHLEQEEVNEAAELLVEIKETCGRNIKEGEFNRAFAKEEPSYHFVCGDKEFSADTKKPYTAWVWADETKASRVIKMFIFKHHPTLVSAVMDAWQKNDPTVGEKRTLAHIEEYELNIARINNKISKYADVSSLVNFGLPKPLRYKMSHPVNHERRKRKNCDDLLTAENIPFVCEYIIKEIINKPDRYGTRYNH